MRPIFPLLYLSFWLQMSQAQITVQDDAKVGLIVTGTGNTINTTQIFGKSPEYAELKKRLDALATKITKKADECGQMAKDGLPDKYRDNCRNELIALNAERDSVQKIETRFREDVIRLAESFSKMELNSERLRLAKALFDEGKIREADNVLNARDMKQEGDALLAEKARAQEKLQRTDSLLVIKADEFALKARLKAIDYTDSLRYDSAQVYFEQSRKYAETVDNLWDFAYLLGELNQIPRAIGYFEAALPLARSESEEASLAMNLGSFYMAVHKVGESEKMYLRSLEIYERLAKSDSTQFESDVALTAMNLGNFYRDILKMDESEKMYLRSLEIYERLAKSDSTQFESDLAAAAMNLGNLYGDILKMDESEKMYLRSLEIYERLAKFDSTQFESDLAMTASNLGNLYRDILKMDESEKMYLRSLEIYERLAKSNPAQFKPSLATVTNNLGLFYKAVQKLVESERMYLRSLDIYEPLAKSNPAQFEPYLGATALNLGLFYSDVQKMAQSEKMYLRALEIFERLAKSNKTQFEPYLALTAMNLGNFYYISQKVVESEKMYLRSLEIYERLAKSNQTQFEPYLALTALNLGNFYRDVQKMDESEKMYLRSLDIYERCVPSNPAQFKPYLAILSNDMGVFYQNQGKLDIAYNYYSRALTLRYKAVLAGQVHFLDELVKPYLYLANLRDSFSMQGNWNMAATIQKELADCIASLSHVSEPFAKQAPQDFGGLSWYCLLARQYTEAQAAAEKTLSLDPTQNWVRTNLGHSYLLRGEWGKAKRIYEEYLKNEADAGEAKQTLGKDWDDLVAAGITCPKMEDARAWLEKK